MTDITAVAYTAGPKYWLNTGVNKHESLKISQ
ncbi:hypothetical protein SHDE107825_05615 [Shewanella denitrificans]